MTSLHFLLLLIPFFPPDSYSIPSLSLWLWLDELWGTNEVCVCLCKCNSAVYCGCVCVWVGWRPRERARRSATVAATASVGPRVWRNSLAIRRGYKKTHTNTQQHFFFYKWTNKQSRKKRKKAKWNTHMQGGQNTWTQIYTDSSHVSVHCDSARSIADNAIFMCTCVTYIL